MEIKKPKSYEDFHGIFASALNTHAPLKTKILRGNNLPHMSKELRKEIMERSKLKSLAIRSNKAIDWANYKRQRNLVVNVNRRTKSTMF